VVFIPAQSIKKSLFHLFLNDMNQLIDTRISKVSGLLNVLTDVLHNHFSTMPSYQLKKIIEEDLGDYIREGKADTVKKILEASLNPLSKAGLKLLLQQQLTPYLSAMKSNLYAVIEAPYVDRMYRDAFYHYYSSKLGAYLRDSCRISFFSKVVEYDDFRDFDDVHDNKLAGCYLGYMVLRPTPHKIIGRTVLSPGAFLNTQFSCCQAKFTATVNGVKFKVVGYPIASQDGQTITCSETTIWSLMEYFGNKFPDYKPVLPSAIHAVLNKIVMKRLIPSDGLSGPQMSYAIRELGFGCMMYSKQKYKDHNQFNALISIYIQSGIPVVGIMQDASGSIGHSVSIIGHETDDLNKISKSNKVVKSITKGKVVDYHDMQRRFVVADDNYPPYMLADFNGSNVVYNGTINTGYLITGIIVPLYTKIYLEANRAKENIYRILNNDKLGIKPDEKAIVKIFLASTRSYKQYLALQKGIEPTLKERLLMIPVSRFVWVAEISSPESFRQGNCDGLVLLDPTEPVKYADNGGSDEGKVDIHSPIIAVYNNTWLYWKKFLNFEKVRIFAPAFPKYRDNLKASDKQ
jgi:hypothetical protein